MDSLNLNETSFLEFDIFEMARKECFSVLNIAIDNLELYDFNINDQDEKGNTLLHIVASKGNIETMQLLLQKADPNILNHRNETPLHLACLYGHTKIASILLNRKAEIRVIDKLGETPIFKSVRSGNVLLTRILATKQKSIVGHNLAQENLLHIACKANKHKNSEDLVKFLLSSNVDPNESSDEFLTPLQIAVLHNHYSIVDLILKSRGDINVTDIRNNSLLHLAAKENHVEICKLLLEFKINPNMQNFEGETALHYAADLNHTEIIKLFINNKVDLDVGDIDSYTPVHVAAKTLISLETLKMLIKAGANPANLTCCGDTPLHLACAAGNLKAMLMLYTKNAANHRNKDGLTAIELAEERGHDILMQFWKRLQTDAESNLL